MTQLYPCPLCDGHHSTRVCPIHGKKIAKGFTWDRAGENLLQAGSQFGIYTVTRELRFSARSYLAEFCSHFQTVETVGNGYATADDAKAACDQHDWQLQSATAGGA